MKTMLTEIFRMQNELNQKIGRDTIGADEITRHNWVFEYLFAAKVEIGELIDCFDLYTGKLILVDNASIEIIDVFHFVVSACHLVGITVDDVSFIRQLDKRSFPITARFSVVVGFDRMCEKLITNNIDWKWWSKTVKEDPSRQFKAIFDINKLKSELINLFEQMVVVATILDLSYDDIFQVYQAKWKKNFERQDNDYDVRNKTEADNLAIIDDLKK